MHSGFNGMVAAKESNRRKKLLFEYPGLSNELLTFDVYILLAETIADSIGSLATIFAGISGTDIVDNHAIRFTCSKGGMDRRPFKWDVNKCEYDFTYELIFGPVRWAPMAGHPSSRSHLELDILERNS